MGVRGRGPRKKIRYLEVRINFTANFSRISWVNRHWRIINKIWGSGGGAPGKKYRYSDVKNEILAKYNKFYEYDVEDDGEISPMFKWVIFRKFFNRRNLMLRKNFKIGIDIGIRPHIMGRYDPARRFVWVFRYLWASAI